jgi:hypothetical protein
MTAPGRDPSSSPCRNGPQVFLSDGPVRLLIRKLVDQNDVEDRKAHRDRKEKDLVIKESCQEIEPGGNR